MRTLILLLLCVASYGQHTNPAPYCAALNNCNTCGGGISRVEISNLDNSVPGLGHYTLFDNLPEILLFPDSSFNTTIAFEPCPSTSWVRIALCYNTASGYISFFGGYDTTFVLAALSTTEVRSFHINVPVTAIPCDTRMRIVRYSGTASPRLCAVGSETTGNYGTTQDYPVRVLGAGALGVSPLSKNLEPSPVYNLMGQFLTYDYSTLPVGLYLCNHKLLYKAE